MTRRAILFRLLCAAMIAGILLCAGMIFHMLRSRAPVYSCAVFVREATICAHV